MENPAGGGCGITGDAVVRIRLDRHRLAASGFMVLSTGFSSGSGTGGSVTLLVGDGVSGADGSVGVMVGGGRLVVSGPGIMAKE